MAADIPVDTAFATPDIFSLTVFLILESFPPVIVSSAEYAVENVFCTPVIAAAATPLIPPP